jgi:hypothetical protein
MPNGNKNGKTAVVSAIIGGGCIIVYIGALLYGALNIYSSVAERRVLGDREFDSLADLAAAAGVLGFMDEKFIQTIQDAIDGSETILGAVISGSKGEFAFERERGTVISWVNNSPRFVPRFGVTRPPKYLPLRIEGQRNVNIQAVSSYLDYDFCIATLKRTLVATLFSLALAFFTLLMDALLGRNTARPRGLPGESAAAAGSTGASGKGKNSAVTPPQHTPAAYAKEKPAAEAGKVPVRAQDGESWEIEEEAAGAGEEDAEDFDFDDEEDFPDFGDAETPAPPLGAAAETPAEASAADPEPLGLFSPRSNAGWESYTRDRLESELHRSASTEQDLALIAVALKEPEKPTEEQFRNFAEEAVHCFEHRDLIFEHGERGLRIICPGWGLEQSLAAAEKFNNLMLTAPRPADSKIELRFGISSRSGRLIDAERIMLEAGEALRRAVEDPASRIVAFKSDPEKYRRYINGRSPRSA